MRGRPLQFATHDFVRIFYEALLPTEMNPALPILGHAPVTTSTDTPTDQLVHEVTHAVPSDLQRASPDQVAA